MLELTRCENPPALRQPALWNGREFSVIDGHFRFSPLASVAAPSKSGSPNHARDSSAQSTVQSPITPKRIHENGCARACSLRRPSTSQAKGSKRTEARPEIDPTATASRRSALGRQRASCFSDASAQRPEASQNEPPISSSSLGLPWSAAAGLLALSECLDRQLQSMRLGKLASCSSWRAFSFQFGPFTARPDEKLRNRHDASSTSRRRSTDWPTVALPRRQPDHSSRGSNRNRRPQRFGERQALLSMIAGQGCPR